MRRAGRQHGHGVVLMVLLATTAIAVFSAATVASLDHGADVVAWQRVGADYRVASAFRQLPDGLDESTIPGVLGSARAYRGTASIDADLTANDLLVLDAPAYSALVRGTPADPQLPAELVELQPASLPVILSTLTATRARITSVGEAFELRIRNQRIPAHVAEIRDVFPSLPANGAFVVASGDQVAALGGSLLLPPTDAFIAAPDGARDALLAALSSLGVSVQLQDRAETASSLRDRPVNRAVATVILGAAGVAGVYAALALVASLALTGSARSIEVAHLRMLGLTRREATLLLVLEYAPVLGLALLVGAAVGLGLFAVLGGSLGLDVLLSASIAIPLALQPVSLALAVGGIVAITALSVGLAGLLQGAASAQGAVRRGIE
jgi:putative ABC transport system permease protein